MPGQEPEKAAKYLRVKAVDHTKEGRPAVNIKGADRSGQVGDEDGSGLFPADEGCQSRLGQH